MRWTLTIVALALSCALSFVAQAQQPAGQTQEQVAQAAPPVSVPAPAPDQVAKIAPLRCAEPVARIVSVQGLVELREPRTATWQRAQLNDALCLYDNIRVGAHSRASVQYSADITVQFDQNSFVTLVEAKDKVSTWVQMWRGALHFITRSRRPFRVITPYVNASVEGTEVYIALAKDRADLTVFEGKLDVANNAGQVLLSSGESATVQGLEAITDDDQFRTLKAQAPQRVLIAKPRDAVQWALYYPPVIDVRPDENVPPNLKAAGEQFRAGNTAEAFAELDRVPVDNWDAQYFIYRASLLLYVGREQEAQADLTLALQQDAKKSDALALQAIIAVVQSDKEQGLSLAQKAVAADPASAAAQIALSYAQQAIFKLEAALQSAEQAAKLDPNNALAYARIAELQLSQGDLDKALVAAKKATELNPNLARTQSILGFSYLTRIDTKNAKETFAKAIQLDSADPLPHLGLGLAKIREGKLEEGRRDIEQAVILDPNNSLIRSYVGKAYYEEKRDELAGKQFEIAKQLDPNDPTPWFYDALTKQTKNKQVDALGDLEESKERNDSRLVYRSWFALDEDRASRAAGLAAIYQDLGLDRVAFNEAVNSITLDPGSHSPHRLLADALVQRDRQEVARVGELLQAQLLQPLGATPVQPALLSRDITLLARSGSSRASFNEYGPMFERSRIRGQFAGITGSQDTLGGEALVSGLVDRFSYSFGRFHYKTDGFRANNDVSHEINDLFAQYAINSKVDIQVAYRQRDSELGDVSFEGDPEVFDPGARQDIDHEIARVGMRYNVTPTVTLLLSAIHATRGERLLTPDLFGLGVRLDSISFNRSNQVEAQYLQRSRWGNLTAGIGGYNYANSTRELFTPGPCLLPSCEYEATEQGRNAYALFNVALQPGSRIITGFSYDAVKEGNFEFSRLSPKLAFTHSISPRLSLRLAALKSVKPALVADQTLQPVQILGFSQFADDTNATISRLVGIALDAHATQNVYMGLDVTARNASFALAHTGPAFFIDLRERSISPYVNWVLGRNTVLSTQYTHETTSIPLDQASTGGVPSKVVTNFAPVALRTFFPNGLFATLRASFVRQRIDNTDSALSERENNQFTLADLEVGYRFPRRLGSISFEVKNIFDKTFSFRDSAYISAQPLNLRFVPERTIIARITLSF